MIKFFSKVDDKRRTYLNKNMLVLKEQYLNIKDIANFGINYSLDPTKALQNSYSGAYPKIKFIPFF